MTGSPDGGDTGCRVVNAQRKASGVVIVGAALLLGGLPLALVVTRVGWLLVAVGIVLCLLIGPTILLVAASARALRPPARQSEYPITFLAWLWSTVKLTGERGASEGDDRHK